MLPNKLPEEQELHFHYLQWLCAKGWEHREIPRRAEVMAKRNGISYDEQLSIYLQRLDKELNALYKQRFVDYILIVYDLFKWCRRMDIMTGPGRGSSAGSLVCFLCGITSIDPIEHVLLFERFISPQRLDMPDIDMDFEDVRRQEVVQYLFDRYGHDNVAQISTTAILKGKSCLKDVARVFEVPFDEVNKVTNSIVERSSGDERASQCIADSFKEFRVCQEFDAKFPQVLKYAVQLEGQARQTGIHAAGVVTSPVPLIDVLPIETRIQNEKTLKVTAIDYWGVGALGLLKLDILGLRTLSQIHDAVKAVKERHGIALDMERVPLDDAATLENFNNIKNYVGIFQYDSTSVEKICERVKFTSFDDVSAVIALDRPGTMRSGLATKWAERKEGRQAVVKLHPLIDEIFKDTLGIMVYQEQVTRLFQEVGGYDPGSADSLRKKIAKKEGEEIIGKERDKFVSGAVAKGVPAEVAGKVMDSVVFFGSYGFNKSHSAAYGAISYWGMWLKTYYPVEFIYGMLKHEPDMGEIVRYVKEARRLGCEVVPPNINTSKTEWTLLGEKSILPALSDIKGVGQRAAMEIIAGQPYSGLSDFLMRVNRRVVHRGVMISLAHAGAMGDFMPNVRAFVENAEHILGKKPEQAEARYKELAASVEEYTDDDKFVKQSEVCPLASGKHPLTAYEETFEAMGKHIQWQKMSEVDYEARIGWFRGVFIEIRYNQVGDFHTTQPDDAEKERIGWGKRYANVNVEDETGTQQRIKVDWDIFEDYRWIIDQGTGTCAVMCCVMFPRSQTIKCVFMADLETMRQDLKEGKPWTGAAAWFKDHPLAQYGAKLADIRKLAGKQAGKKGAKATGLVGWILAVKDHLDKNQNKMCFFDMAGMKGCISGLCFASSYPTYEDALKPGNVVKVDLVRSDGASWYLDDQRGCTLEVLAKLSAT